jgi:hypothetical protein
MKVDARERGEWVQKKAGGHLRRVGFSPSAARDGA